MFTSLLVVTGCNISLQKKIPLEYIRKKSSNCNFGMCPVFICNVLRLNSFSISSFNLSYKQEMTHSSNLTEFRIPDTHVALQKIINCLNGLFFKLTGLMGSEGNMRQELFGLRAFKVFSNS